MSLWSSALVYSRLFCYIIMRNSTEVVARLRAHAESGKNLILRKSTVESGYMGADGSVDDVPGRSKGFVDPGDIVVVEPLEVGERVRWSYSTGVLAPLNGSSEYPTGENSFTSDGNYMASVFGFLEAVPTDNLVSEVLREGGRDMDLLWGVGSAREGKDDGAEGRQP